MALFREAGSVGVGSCDKCLIRLFADESIYVVSDEILCQDCYEEDDVDGSNYQRAGD